MRQMIARRMWCGNKQAHYKQHPVNVTVTVPAVVYRTRARALYPCSNSLLTSTHVHLNINLIEALIEFKNFYL